MADRGQDADRAEWACANAEGADVLHVGCGSGLAAVLLAREGKRVVGTEREPSDLAAARHRFVEESEGVQESARFVAADPEKLPFEAAEFDTVVFESDADPDAAVREAARVLRPKGRVLVLAEWAGARPEVAGAGASTSSLLAALGPRVNVELVEDAGEWIGLLGRLRSRASRAAARVVPIEALRVAERRLERSLGAERERAGEVEAARGELERLAGAKEESDDRVFGLSHEVRALRGRERDLNEIVAGRREQTARLEEQRASLIARTRDLEARIEEIEVRAAAILEETEARAAALLEETRARAAEQLEEREGRIGELRNEADLSEAKRQEAIEAGKRAATEEQRIGAELEELEGTREKLSGELEARKGELDRVRSELQQSRSSLAALTKRMRALRASRSYKLMRGLWRVNAAIKRPFRGRRRAAELEAPAEPERSGARAVPEARPEAPAAAPRAKPAPQAPAPQAPSGEVEVDAERRRWLAKVGPPRGPGELRVAAVLDEMSRACFAPECDLLTFGSDDWRETLEERRPHLLLVESTWQGNSGSWQYQVASYDHPDYAGRPKLNALVDWCRERDIPTVFWNKEDPVHFERFKGAASLFDHVLTTDSNCIERYAAIEGRRAGTIEALAFAAQPRIHNPIAPSAERSDSPCFAGAYYRDRHADRRASLEMLLDAARPHDLVIYDRTYGTEDDAFGFPERFQANVRPALPYERMLAAYKEHKVFLNVNSVADSPTMFSRRVFELAACDTAVLSTESLGVEAIFDETVPIVKTPAEASEALEGLLGDEEHRRRLVVAARRLVLGEHTYRRRLAEIAATAGYEVSPEAGEEIAVLVLVDDVDQARAIRDLASAISEQTTLPSELLIGVGARTSVAGDLHQLMDPSEDLRVRVTQQDSEASRMERYRELAAIAASPWVAVVHTAHSYGRHHFSDLLACTRFADADVIGAAAFETKSGDGVNPDLEHRYAEFPHPHSVLAKRGVIAKRGWEDEMPSAWTTLDAWRHEGVGFYGADRESFKADPALGLPPRRTRTSASPARANQ